MPQCFEKQDIFQRYERGEVVTVNDQGRYLLVEFAFQGIPYQAEEVLFQLMARGIIPIISHPERNMEIGERPKRYYEMIRIGCLGQVTAMSLTGHFGTGVRRIAESSFQNDSFISLPRMLILLMGDRPSFLLR
jgi:protein-tyrosine phosphatase